MKVITESSIDVYPLLYRGKVRDVYEIDERTLLVVTTDRMSAFDVVLPEPVPYKGVILNLLTLFWMRRFEDIIPNHVIESEVDNFPQSLFPWRDELENRAVIVRKARPLPIECITRGYLAGSAWEEYKKTGQLWGQELPSGMSEAAILSPPLFTPSTKAGAGEHDENISIARAAALVGDDIARKVELVCLRLYESGSDYADQKGIIVADTKFELGFIDGSLHLIDEVLTPDSSRFWPKAEYMPGKSQPSFDKQYLRDWLRNQPWNRKAPAPDIPPNIIENTAKRYMEAYTRLTGLNLQINS